MIRKKSLKLSPALQKGLVVTSLLSASCATVESTRRSIIEQSLALTSQCRGPETIRHCDEAVSTLMSESSTADPIAYFKAARVVMYSDDPDSKERKYSEAVNAYRRAVDTTELIEHRMTPVQVFGRAIDQMCALESDTDGTEELEKAAEIVKSVSDLPIAEKQEILKGLKSLFFICLSNQSADTKKAVRNIVFTNFSEAMSRLNS